MPHRNNPRRHARVNGTAHNRPSYSRTSGASIVAVEGIVALAALAVRDTEGPGIAPAGDAVAAALQVHRVAHLAHLADAVEIVFQVLGARVGRDGL